MPDLAALLNTNTLTGVGAAALVIYALMRQIRKDSREDAQANTQSVFYDTLLKQNNELVERCDRMSAERNAALMKVAQAEAELLLAKARLNDCERRIAPDAGSEVA